MRQCFSTITILIILFPLLFFTVSSVLAVSDEVNINLQSATGVVCDYDGTCESGEDETNCSSDCGCNNNGICESARGENESTCRVDCFTDIPLKVILEEVLPRIREEMDIVPPWIMDISTVAGFSSATTSWYTSELALCQFFWGETSEYKTETITEVAYSIIHKVYLSGLLPETTYHFKIKAIDRKGNFTFSTDKTFTTRPLIDTIPPTNVSNFEAIGGDEKITLTWQNPSEPDFKAVKIMRSEKFYPSHPLDGLPVYNDKGTSFIDTGLTNGQTYYYTAFAYDESGNYSSGAVALAAPYPPGKPPIVPPIFPPVVPPELVPPAIEELRLEDFDFIQENKKLAIINGKLVEAKTELPLTISIDYEKVPEVLKTIMIILKKGEKVFSFLLRIDEEKTQYLATLIPPPAGDYPLNITVFDFKNQAVKRISGELITKETGAEATVSQIPWYEQRGMVLLISLGVVGILIIVPILKRGLGRKKKPSSSGHSLS